MLAQPKNDMIPVRVINPSPVPVTLYQNTSVSTFSQLDDGALGPASCNRLATKKQRQTKPLASEQFDLDAMNLNSAQRKGLASLLDNSQISFHRVRQTWDRQVLCITVLILETTLLLSRRQEDYQCTSKGRYAST